MVHLSKVTPKLRPIGPRFRLEKGFLNKHIRVGGGDEAGRGPWAGPVVAAIVTLNPSRLDGRYHDSKQVAPALREILFEQICREALAFGIGEASPFEIDQINILEATRLAFCRAWSALTEKPGALLMDALVVAEIPIPQTPIVKGDEKSLSIGAASILAKVHRDRMMVQYDREYPGYGFGQHKGYGTEAHQKALRALGVSPIHRLSFKPVAAALKRGPH